MIRNLRGALRGKVIDPPQLSQASTRSLLRRGRLGDREALDRLFGRLLLGVRRWAHGRLPRGARDLHDTADLVQDAAVGVWRHLDHINLERPGDLDAYVRQAVRNRIRDEARRVGRRPDAVPIDLDLELQDDSPSPLDRALTRDALTNRDALWVRLSSDERELLVARFQFGYSYEEIARLMSRPSSAAARMAVNRLVLRLRTLSREHAAPECVQRASSR